jgi:hypothetical protein
MQSASWKMWPLNMNSCGTCRCPRRKWKERIFKAREMRGVKALKLKAQVLLDRVRGAGERVQ